MQSNIAESWARSRQKYGDGYNLASLPEMLSQMEGPYLYDDYASLWDKSLAQSWEEQQQELQDAQMRQMMMETLKRRSQQQQSGSMQNPQRIMDMMDMFGGGGEGTIDNMGSSFEMSEFSGGAPAGAGLTSGANTFTAMQSSPMMSEFSGAAGSAGGGAGGAGFGSGAGGLMIPSTLVYMLIGPDEE